MDRFNTFWGSGMENAGKALIFLAISPFILIGLIVQSIVVVGQYIRKLF